MYCDKSFVKPAIRLRIARPMCNGRPFALSPFRRLASRGHPFRGSPCWWAMQFVIYLARCLTLHDSVPRYREGSQYHYSCPHDTLSCLFCTALWLGQCQTILTQTQQSDDIDMACCRILPIDPITCSHVRPRSLARLASWKMLTSLPPHLRWRRDALQPLGIQQVRRDGNTCIHIPDGGLRCVSWNTRGLTGSPFSPQSSRERKHNYFTRRTQNNDIVCLQDTHGKDEFLQAIQVPAPRFRPYGILTPNNVNADGSAFCLHKWSLAPCGRQRPFRADLTLRSLRERLPLITPHWPLYLKLQV